MKVIDWVVGVWNKHDTKILTGIAVVGAIVTPILASRATLKAKEVIDEYDEERTVEEPSEDTETVTLIDKASLHPSMTNGVILKKEGVVWYKNGKIWKKLLPIYAATMVSGGITIWAIIFCHKIHLDKEASLAAMSLMWEGRYKALEKKVKEKVSPETVKEIKEEIKEEHGSKKADPKENLLKEFWVYDRVTKQRFKTCANNFIWANKTINEHFSKGYKVSWSYIINLLGGKKTALGDTIGFDPDNDEFMEFLDYNEVGYFGYYWFDVYADVLVDEKANATLNGTVIPTIGCNIEPWDLLPFK